MTPTLQIPLARVFLPLKEPSRYKAAYGGRGSGKSHFFGGEIISECLRVPGTRAVCIREVQKDLRTSSKLLIEDKIRKFGLSDLFDVKRTEISAPGNGLIIFEGMQDHTADSIKSLEGFRIAWFEEAQNASQRSLDLLRPTLRGGAEIWFSWNPERPDNPVDNFFRGADEKPPNSRLVEVNYWDNPWFPDDLREEMEYDRRRDPDKYNWIWRGQYRKVSAARVFHNWKIGEMETPAPHHGGRPYFGADWGFSVDPTVLVRMWVFGRTIYIDREVYKVGCEIDQTPALFDQLNDGMYDPRAWPIIADSARPETISYMQKHGYPRIEPSVKGANSVEEGVRFLQSYDIVVHPSCRHTTDELTMYSYKQDKKTEEILPELEDSSNHCIDAARYALEKLRTGFDAHTYLKAFGG